MDFLTRPWLDFDLVTAEELQIIVAWALGLPALFLLTVWVVERHSPTLRVMRGRQGSKASLLLAYEVTTLASNAYLAVAGLLTWLPNGPFASSAAAAAADRLYADVPLVRSHILHPMLAHCGWDLMLYSSVPELREPALIAHHLVTVGLGRLTCPHDNSDGLPLTPSCRAAQAALGYFALRPVSFAHHFDIFFAGVAEVQAMRRTATSLAYSTVAALLAYTCCTACCRPIATTPLKLSLLELLPSRSPIFRSPSWRLASSCPTCSRRIRSWRPSRVRRSARASSCCASATGRCSRVR